MHSEEKAYTSASTAENQKLSLQQKANAPVRDAPRHSSEEAASRAEHTACEELYGQEQEHER